MRSWSQVSQGSRARSVAKGCTLHRSDATCPLRTCSPCCRNSHRLPLISKTPTHARGSSSTSGANNVFADLDRMISESQPDLVIREGAELASWALAERERMAYVTVGVASSTGEWDAMAGPQIAELGRRASVPGLRAESMYRYGLLVFQPAGFRDWSDTPTERVYRPYRRATAGMDDRIGAFDNHPIVYVTLGSPRCSSGCRPTRRRPVRQRKPR
jgi:hypothetical protein